VRERHHSLNISPTQRDSPGRASILVYSRLFPSPLKHERVTNQPILLNSSQRAPIAAPPSSVRKLPHLTPGFSDPQTPVPRSSSCHIMITTSAHTSTLQGVFYVINNSLARDTSFNVELLNWYPRSVGREYYPVISRS